MTTDAPPTVTLTEPHRFLFLHGWSLGPAQWSPLVERLDAGSEVHHGVLPGHAGSPESPGWSVESLAARLIDTGSPAIWVGGSLGGQVALAAATLAPEAVRGLVLIGATPCFVERNDWPHAMPRTVFEDFRAACRADPTHTRERFDTLQFQGDRGGRAGLRALRRLATGQVSATPAGLEEGLRVLADTDLRESLPTIACPTLWIAGEADALVPAAAARHAAGKQPCARVCYVPGAGHAPYVTQTDALADVLRTWLREAALSEPRESLA